MLASLVILLLLARMFETAQVTLATMYKFQQSIFKVLPMSANRLSAPRFSQFVQVSETLQLKVYTVDDNDLDEMTTG